MRVEVSRAETMAKHLKKKEKADRKFQERLKYQQTLHKKLLQQKTLMRRAIQEESPRLRGGEIWPSSKWAGWKSGSGGESQMKQPGNTPYPRWKPWM